MAMVMATVTTSTCCNRVDFSSSSSSLRVDFSALSSHLLCRPSPHVSFSSLPLRIVPFPRSSPPHMASIFASSARTEDVEVEPATKVKFPRSIVAPGGSAALSLVGTGFREKSIAFIGVKVYAIGLYLDNGISPSLVSWKGKGGDELSKDNSFFKAVVGAQVEKAIKIVLVRDVDGATFWEALDGALTPRLKAANAGSAGQEALNAFGEVFRGKSLKQGTSIYLTWIQPSKLQVALSGDGMINATVEGSIISSPLVSALYDVYLGENPVSPTAKASTATGLAALL